MTENTAQASPDLLQAALWYATKLGWPVFPLAAGTKVPPKKEELSVLVDGKPMGGFYVASTDPEQIRAWWKRWPKANIGVATGAAGLVVVDVDVKHNQPGLESWHDLRADLRLNDTTPTVETPTHGLHVYYRAGKFGVRSSEGTVAPGIDVRGEPGYTVLPPSVTPQGSYGWAMGYSPHECEMLEIPERFAVRLGATPKGITIKKQTPAEPVGDIIPHGTQHRTLVSLAGSMRRRGMGAAEIEAALQIVNETRCEVPGPREHIHKIAQSIANLYDPATDATWPEDVATPDTASQPVATISLTDLLAASFSDPVWIVEDLLPVGLAFLAARPKFGKSFFALQLALAQSAGAQFLGHPLKPAKALYIALEDSPKRMQRRLEGMHAEPKNGLAFAFRYPALNDPAGFATLENAITTDGLRLVVIDTLARAIRGRIDWDDVSQVTTIMGQLQELALANDVCILLIDHHRKNGNGTNDAVDDVMGSTGKVAVADTIMGMYRKRGERTATLGVTGRDVEEQTLALTFDAKTLTWILDGDDAPPGKMYTRQGQMLRLLEDWGEGTTTELAEALDMPKGNVSRELAELIAKGHVIRGTRTKNGIPYIPTLGLERVLDDNGGNDDNSDNHDNNDNLSGKKLSSYPGTLDLAAAMTLQGGRRSSDPF